MHTRPRHTVCTLPMTLYPGGGCSPLLRKSTHTEHTAAGQSARLRTARRTASIASSPPCDTKQQWQTTRSIGYARAGASWISRCHSVNVMLARTCKLRTGVRRQQHRCVDKRRAWYKCGPRNSITFHRGKKSRRFCTGSLTVYLSAKTKRGFRPLAEVYEGLAKILNVLTSGHCTAGHEHIFSIIEHTCRRRWVRKYTKLSTTASVLNNCSLLVRTFGLQTHSNLSDTSYDGRLQITKKCCQFVDREAPMVKSLG